MLGKPSFDLFLSYNPLDLDVVQQFTQNLEQSRVTLQSQGQEADGGLEASRACAILIGVNGVGSLERKEFNTVFQRAIRDQVYSRFAKEHVFNLFIVLLPGFQDTVESQSFLSFFNARLIFDFRDGLTDSITFQKFIQSVKNKEPSKAKSPETTLDNTLAHQYPELPKTNLIPNQNTKNNNKELRLKLLLNLSIVSGIVLGLLFSIGVIYFQDIRQQFELKSNEVKASITTQAETLQKLDISEYSHKLAFSRELAANALLQLSSNPELSLLLAVEAAKVYPTQQAEDSLRQALSKTSVPTLRLANAGPLMSAAFSPDGKQIITGGEDGSVRIWDSLTGKEIKAFRSSRSPIYSVAYSPDGKLAATEDRNGDLLIWEITTGKELTKLPADFFLISTTSFSPDSKLLITQGQLWETATGNPLIRIKGLEGKLRSSAFSPDGKLVVMVSLGTSLIQVAEAGSGNVVAELQGHTDNVWQASFNPESTLIVTASSDTTVRIWDAQTGRQLALLQGHNASVKSAVFSPNGNLVVTASSDNTARVWDVATGQSLQVLKGHTQEVKSAMFSNDNKFVVTASADKTVRVWDVATGQSLQEIKGYNDIVNNAVFSPDVKSILTVSNDGVVLITNCQICGSVDDLLSQAHTHITRELSKEERVKYLHET